MTKMTNRPRMDSLLNGAGRRLALFRCGQVVRDRQQRRGVIDCVFADYAALLDGGAVHRGWYEMQTMRPATSKDDFWYSIILEEGAIVQGQADLQAEDS